METNIAKQIIDQKVNKLMVDNPLFFEHDDEGRRRSKCFLLLGVAAYLNMDILEAYSYITDGGNDGGFDAAYIQESHDGQVDIVLFQSKYTLDWNKDAAFPANAVEKAVNTIKTVFDPAYTTELNGASKKVVDEIRSLILDGYIPYVTFVMINNGNKWQSDAQNIIDNAFGDQEQVRFEHFGYQDILGYIEKKEPIDAEIKMAGAAIHENFNFKSVIVGKVNISEIYKLMESYGDQLLERNIRKYLGKNEINDSISASLRSDKRSNFYFYNNGITMVCDKFTFNALQEKNWIVKTNGLQIINGGQTCRTIYQTIKDDDSLDMENVFVLVRIYEVSDDEDIVQEITYATNHQNPVDLRDLKSNDSYQTALEIGAKELGYIYKRKRDNSTSSGTIPVSVAAEAVESIWRVSPHLARYKKAELFGAFYNGIFSQLNAAQMIIAVLVFRYCDSVRKRVTENKDLKIVRAYGNYFIACLAGQKLRRELGLQVDQITHVNFEKVKSYFEDHKERLVNWAENSLIDILRKYHDLKDTDNLYDMDGRTIAAAFRRFDIVEQYIKNESWWENCNLKGTP